MSLKTATDQANLLTLAMRRAEAASGFTIGVGGGGGGGQGNRQVLVALQQINDGVEALRLLEPARLDTLTALRGEGLV